MLAATSVRHPLRSRPCSCLRQNSLSPISPKNFTASTRRHLKNRKSLPIIKRAATFDAIDENGDSSLGQSTRLGLSGVGGVERHRSHGNEQRELLDQMKLKLLQRSDGATNGFTPQTRLGGPKISFNETLLNDKPAT